MLVYKIDSSDSVISKVEQLKSVGMSTEDLDNAVDILRSSIQWVYQRNFSETLWIQKLSNYDEVINENQFVPWAFTYNFIPTEQYDYNMFGISNSNEAVQELVPLNSLFIMNNSCNYESLQFGHEVDAPESTKSSRKFTMSGSTEELKMSFQAQNSILASSKIGLLRKVLEGIDDDSQVLISAKPKNKSQKVRRSNRHSKYRGVSLNGKKWQVMIMGSIRKKYYGSIATETEAAIFYDKLSILTNGLGAKTNFNYRKSDLMRILPELEYMEPIVSN